MTGTEMKNHFLSKGFTIVSIGKYCEEAFGFSKMRVGYLLNNKYKMHELPDELLNVFSIAEKKIQPKTKYFSSKELKGYRYAEDGLFCVTPCGDVFRRTKYGYIAAAQCKNGRKGNRNKHRTVSASVDGKQKHFYVHRLVAECYIPNPRKKAEVHHLNGHGWDNHVSNLVWVTKAEHYRMEAKLRRARNPVRAIQCHQCGKKAGLGRLTATTRIVLCSDCRSRNSRLHRKRVQRVDREPIIRVLEKYPEQYADNPITVQIVREFCLGFSYRRIAEGTGGMLSHEGIRLKIRRIYVSIVNAAR